MPRTSSSVLSRIERELEQLEQRRNELDRAIAHLRRVAARLQRRAAPQKVGTDQRESTPQSLTNHCRAVLRMSTPNGLTPREVKRLLTESGFAWENFTNPMSAVHTVLKRLVQQQEAVTMTGRDGERRFSVRPTRVIALTRNDTEDSDFLKKLLEANSPEAVVALVKDRRTRSR